MKFQLTILFGFIICFCHAQELNTLYKPISLDQGHINDIMRDSEGFIWISTQDGLTKYNGTEFIQYNYDRKDENSIPNNYVWKTFEDSKSNLWIGLFGGGLCRFDKTQEVFYRYKDFGTIADHGIRSFAQLNDSTLVVGTDHGLYLFDLNSNSFDADTSFQDRQFEIGHVHTHSLEVIGTDIIVAGENGGYIISTPDKSVKRLQFDNKETQKMGFIRKISGDQYLLTDETYVFLAEYNALDKTFQRVGEIQSDFPLSVHDISADSDGSILLVTEEGLYKINFSKHTLEQIAHDQPLVNNIVDKVAYCVEEIEDDLKWIGTKTHIYEFSQKKQAFNYILSTQLCESAVLGMAEDSLGNLWIATRMGLGRIKNFNQKPENWEYFCYNKDTNPEIRNAYILNVKIIDESIFIGHRKRGFSLLKLLPNDKVKFEKPPEFIDNFCNHGSVSNFYKDSHNNIWISTSGNGVIKWNNNDRRIVKQYKNEDGNSDILSHNYTFSFVELDSTWIAAGTAAGISVINQKTDSTYQIIKGEDSLSLSGNFIMDFHRDSKNQLWICTDGGINLWQENNAFKYWTKNEGLPNDIIYGMLEHQDELWFSSNRGLTRFTNDSNPTFKTFLKNDDVLNVEHNQFSFLKSKNNLLLFGGKDGITYFNPSDIKNNKTDAKTVIESFQLFNRSGDSKLNKHINYVDEVVLNHNENFFSFELSSLSYFKSDQNHYRYRLLPYNTDWIELGTRNFFSLNGLSPGSYILEIQSSNNDQVWGENIKTLNIVIKNPMYLRWYAWLLYTALLVIIIYTYYSMKVNHLTSLAEAREEERTKIRERSAKDFHDEVGSLITKLSLLNQYLLSETPKESSEKRSILTKMENNIQRIRTGMKDFIWVLDPNKDLLGSTIIKIKEIGNELFEHSGIRFRSSVGKTIKENTELNGVQRRQVILLVKEALHNVLKHSKATNCLFQINQTNENIGIIIKDDGQGFNIDTNEMGYGLKSMSERARKINGSFDVTSSSNAGTTITVTIPTHPNGL